jgi:uncharacterized protein (TIGR03086 family)
MSTEALEQAIASTRAVLAEIKPDQLGDATPCASWKVSDIINHIVGGQFYFASAVNGETSEGEAPDFAAGDYNSAFDQGSAACVAAFQGDGAMERIIHLPFGDMPGSVFVGIAATDTFVHGWDLAKAIGQGTDLAPALASGLLANIRPVLPDAFRGADGAAPFGPEQTAPAGASNADQLAAFLGRSV